jgi:Caspase domain
MSRHWAILIGANQYQFRQPLLCAHEDAQSLHRFLTQAAGVAPATCVLLSDRAPKIGDTATYPTAETLKTWLGGLSTAAIQPTDTLWIFFSGYGEYWEGQDYLLPLDAAAAYDANTWLATRSLYSRLSQLPTKNILLLLDMNRSQSARSGNPLGRQTMQHAKEFGISTILSCQPEQFSHESAALSNGFFTAALLEGLREHAGAPLIKLVRFLQVRLPELSEQHQRPRQDPIIMVAPVHLEQWRCPALQPVPPPATTLIQTSTTTVQPPTTVIQAPPEMPGATPQTVMPQPEMTQTPIPSPTPTPIGRPAIGLDTVTQPAAVPPLARLARTTASKATANQATANQGDEINPRQVLLQILVLGSLLAMVLGLSKVLWRGNAPVSWGTAPTATSPAKAPAGSPTGSPMPTAASPDPSPRLNVPQSPPADSAKILDEARALIRPTNASEVQRAIERASQIPPGDGRYDETQRQIDRWCVDILDIAKQRAQQGKYPAAIAAAQLVPENRGQHSAAAKILIKQWQKAGR